MKRNLAITLIILLVFLGIYFTYLLYNTVEKQTIAIQNKQQEIYTRQLSLSIKDFYDNLNYSLKYLSQKDEIIDFTEETKLEMQQYYHSHSDELNAITRISPTGEILYTFPYVKSAIGKNVSSQKHNAEIIKNHTPTLSDQRFRSKKNNFQEIGQK